MKYVCKRYEKEFDYTNLNYIFPFLEKRTKHEANKMAEWLFQNWQPGFGQTYPYEVDLNKAWNATRIRDEHKPYTGVKGYMAGDELEETPEEREAGYKELMANIRKICSKYDPEDHKPKPGEKLGFKGVQYRKKQRELKNKKAKELGYGSYTEYMRQTGKEFVDIRE